MKAMIFAAGLGTRLKPLTNTMPKAMVPIAGKPLLEHVILKLKSAGFDEIIINVHHFADQISKFIKDNNNFDIRIEISDEQEQLLETGGGIKKAASFFDDGLPFLVHNVDILSNIDLKAMYRSHIESKAMATLLVSKRETSRYLLFNENMKLEAWINEKTGETKPTNKIINPANLQKLAFSGIHIISPQIFDKMKSWENKFSIIDFYLSEIETQIINGFNAKELKMVDVGKFDSLEKAEKLALEILA